MAATSCFSGAVLGGSAVLAAQRWLVIKWKNSEEERPKPPVLPIPARELQSFEVADSETPAAKTPYPAIGGETALWHSGWAKPKVEKAGIAPHVTLVATLPYTVQPHAEEQPEMLLTTCNVYAAPSIKEMVHDVLRTREVAGVPGVTFGDIVDIVLNKGASRVYIAGGFLRDAFCGKVGDDMDFLLRSTGGSLVPFLETVAKSKGWPVYRKSDERTGQARWDFIAIGDKDHKMKWSAHPCGSGCEGDFCMNTLLYDVYSGALIDPTGQGIQDSVNFILRHNRGCFREWTDEDRLVGMKLIRYFNFVTRGYSPNTPDFRREVVEETLRVLPTPEGRQTASVFFKRKIIRGDAETSKVKESCFRHAFIEEAMKSGLCKQTDAMKFYLEHFAPCFYAYLDKFPGLRDAVIPALQAEALKVGYTLRLPD
eukprot:TRINITY_DN28075_c0_g1_i1.p1 TRINITY_DN28075_c0_g1~~TRINITY_DN28075_c0_g1_i1.p1  ORF type:complete len:444 (+),score=76.56 TRINITY_DN28075_c0_g1_i1:59-1333(+)